MSDLEHEKTTVTQPRRCIGDHRTKIVETVGAAKERLVRFPVDDVTRHFRIAIGDVGRVADRKVDRACKIGR